MRKRPVILALALALVGSEAAAYQAPGFALRWGGSGSVAGKLALPEGLGCNQSGQVYVADFLNNRIQVFSGTGEYLSRWRSLGSDLGSLQGPADVAISADGYAYVVEFQGCRISKFTQEGSFVTAWGKAGSGSGEFAAPSAVDLSSAGNIYVVDGANQRIQEFNPDGVFVRMWGELGSGPGQFHNPGGIAIDAQDRVYVTDGVNARIQVFAADGTFLSEWPFSESWTIGFPGAICIDNADGKVYVTDLQRQEVCVFTEDGTQLGHWGEYGKGPGYFNHPLGLAVDGNSNVFVADTDNDYVQKFDPNLPPLPPRPNYPVKILLHATVGRQDSCHTAIAHCEDAKVEQGLSGQGGPFYSVYLLVARGTISSVSGLQCGITYDGGVIGLNGQGVDVLSWVLCADMEFHAAYPPGAPDWPGPGSGTIITWSGESNCQVNDIAVAGYFYVAAYSSERLKIIPRPVDNLAAVVDCVPPFVAVNLTEADLGYVGFSADQSVAGCNPCFADCRTGTNSQKTTWSWIKSLYAK